MTTPRRERRSRVAAIAATVCATTLVAACGSSGSGGGGGAADGPPQSGGTLRIGISSDAACLDPHQTGNHNVISMNRQVVDSLTDQDAETMELGPWLAESWEVDPNNTRFTFKLRQGVTFSDGAPFDSGVVKANLESIAALGPLSSLGAAMVAGIESVETPDPSTVVVKFSQPNPQFLNATSTTTLGMLSPAALQASPEARCNGEGLIGSGSFVVESRVKDASTVLTKRTGYNWPSGFADHAGDAYLDRIEFNIVPESSVRVGSLQSGELDIIDGTAAQDIPALEAGGYVIEGRANPGIPMVLFLNREKEVWQDPAVRQAVQIGINRQQLMDTVFTDLTPPSKGTLAATTTGFVDQSDLLAYDPDAARALLEGAGYTRNGGSGIYEKNGTPVSFDVIQFYPNETPTIELMQQQLAEIGIGVEIRAMSSSESDAVEAAGDWDTIYAHWTRPDPDILRVILDSTGENPYRNAPSELDAMLQAQAVAPSQEERARILEDAMNFIIEQGVVIPIHDFVNVWAMSESVQGFEFDSGSRLKLYDAWLS
ncbi:ABC transporter substrate-binding protein [Mycobacterium sp. 236(2023)]|uniref:ABC transporter substrate-binding protein n=1 Tax=Mycobacterium sp. 236(2023) TaxID=3038163 RepID=UPI0024153CA6|nr:ABC transporter substrate-binding protein [Mycobacterium sp. 236(2023)]MDG4663807.1 ABC transporter substrate-binding protein [Mycobacterium sp. 236(2023)]